MCEKGISNIGILTGDSMNSNIDKMNGELLNISADKKAQLQQSLPVVFTKGKIDWEKLKAALGELIGGKEK